MVMIEKLTHEQTAMFGPWVDKWIQIGRTTGPADMQTFSHAVRQIYRLSKLAEPEHIVCVESPVLAMWVTSILSTALANKEIFDPEALPIREPFKAPVVRAVQNVFSRCKLPKVKFRKHMLRAIQGTAQQLWSSYFGGQFWSGYNSYITFFTEVCHLQLSDHLAECERYYREAQVSVGWWYATEKVVVASDHPLEFHMNKERRAHLDLGSALTFGHGFDYYFLNGVSMPKEVVMTPADQLDAKMILRIENVEQRRELVRKIGAEKLCEDLGAEVLDRDGNYELIAVKLRDGVARPYLKMVNPSIGVYHIEGVARGVTTVQEALNYRNGLRPEDIDDVNGADWYQQGDVLLFPEDATKFKSRPIKLT